MNRGEEVAAHAVVEANHMVTVATLTLAADTFQLAVPSRLAARLRLAPRLRFVRHRQIVITVAGSQVTRVVAFEISLIILKRLTCMGRQIVGWDTTPAGTMRTTISIIPGNMDAFAANSDPGISTGLRAGTGIVSGSADFILASHRMTMITSMTGIGEVTIS